MPLGLVPRVRTQALDWQHQEVHHCAIAVAGRRFCEYSRQRALFGSKLARVWAGSRISVNRIGAVEKEPLSCMISASLTLVYVCYNDCFAFACILIADIPL